MLKKIKIVIPLAGGGKSFKNAGYTFPKPLIDVNGKPMIQIIAENLKPKIPFEFIFICLKEHYNKYSLHEIFKNATNDNFQCIQMEKPASGAACTVLNAVDLINNDDDIIIANSDQIIDLDINKFINYSRKSQIDGVIITFESNHPRWSYALVDKKNNVIEVAEKKVISNNATAGIYYYRKGKDFVKAAYSMIQKDIRINNEFYICPIFNEMIINDKLIKIYPIDKEKMHGLGTPEDLNLYLQHNFKKP